MSGFAQIAKVRHHKVEKLQKELADSTNRLLAQKTHLQALRDEISAEKAPDDGLVGTLANFKKNLAIFRDEILRTENEVLQIEKMIITIKKELKFTQIEFEKMDHLQKDLDAKRATKIKSQEIFRLEEAALNGHYIKNRDAI